MAPRDIVLTLDLSEVPTPAFLVSEAAMARNLEILADVRQRTGCTMLLALKAFSMFSMFPQVRSYLDGVCASGPFEARLGHEEFGGQVHTYAPAYSERDFADVARYSDHISFNSITQWYTFRHRVPENVRCGLRVNPGFSEVEPEIYNPCAPFSRLGIPVDRLADADLDGITGLHFHTHCEQNADALERTLNVIDDTCGDLLHGMQWVNLGGGHHITRPDYDVDLLCDLVTGVQEKYNVKAILEPGEAVALNAGLLAATVLDTVYNGMDIAVLDTSAAAHMPDVLEMPYRPEVVGAGLPDEKAHTYRLTGNTCLAGDVIGDYGFDRPLQQGDRIVLQDMAHYTMVKTNTFNGMPLPAIGIIRENGKIDIVKKFGYGNFKDRLS